MAKFINKEGKQVLFGNEIQYGGHCARCSYVKLKKINPKCADRRRYQQT